MLLFLPQLLLHGYLPLEILLNTTYRPRTPPFILTTPHLRHLLILPIDLIKLSPDPFLLSPLLFNPNLPLLPLLLFLVLDLHQ